MVMGVVIWAVLRQLEALRESVAYTLEKGAFSFTHQYEIFQEDGKLSCEGFAKWVSDQGITPVVLVPTDFETQEQIGEQEVSLLLSMENLLEAHYPNKRMIWHANFSSTDSQNAPDFGVHRSGVGWHSLPNFVVSSALVRLLGAYEQFELDVLKSLLYYRPDGRAKSFNELNTVIVSSDILMEEPDEDGAYSKPAIWTWIKKTAENNIERKKIFSRVYAIEVLPENFENLSSKETNKFIN
jgi:hypothetical protein